MRVIKKVWKKSIWVFIAIQFLVAFIFLYLMTLIPPSELQLKIALASLAVVFASTAAMNIFSVQSDKKMEQIITKLDEIKEEQQARSSITCLIDMGLKVLEHFSKQKEKE